MTVKGTFTSQDNILFFILGYIWADELNNAYLRFIDDEYTYSEGQALHTTFRYIVKEKYPDINNWLIEQNIKVTYPSMDDYGKELLLIPIAIGVPMHSEAATIIAMRWR